jgi:hypothetical protein
VSRQGLDAEAVLSQCAADAKRSKHKSMMHWKFSCSGRDIGGIAAPRAAEHDV